MFVERFIAHTPTPVTNSGFDDAGFNPFGPDATTPGGLRNLPDISFPEPLPDLTAPEETTPETETPVIDPPATESPQEPQPETPSVEPTAGDGSGEPSGQ